jgi:hypothetical protein
VCSEWTLHNKYRLGDKDTDGDDDRNSDYQTGEDKDFDFVDDGDSEYVTRSRRNKNSIQIRSCSVKYCQSRIASVLGWNMHELKAQMIQIGPLRIIYKIQVEVFGDSYFTE